MENKNFKLKQFVIITLITSIWIHIGEIARAILVAFPRMEAFFGDRMAIGPMEISNAIVWGVWDTLLTAILVFILWLSAVAFGNNLKAIIVSGTTTALATIGVFWIATINTGLGEWGTAAVIFPLAWIEMIIGAWIASKLYSRKNNS